MKWRLLLILISLSLASAAGAQNVTIAAVDQPAALVFRSLIEQTGKNFVYSSDLLQDVRVTVSASNRPLKSVLDEMFAGTTIEYKIKGKNVVLKRKKIKKQKTTRLPQAVIPNRYAAVDKADAKMLEELVVVSRIESPAVATAEIGARKVSADEVRNTPALFGEADVIKALQTQAGVGEATEGMAGMNVHGGGVDENLYMLENVPLYQVNHFAGLFSAFNTDIIRYIDFFKSSMPAKYEGRLSSFMDVRLLNGNTEGHHGNARLGLSSGAFNISGPIGKRTTYLVGLRRSWFDVLTLPLFALINSSTEDKAMLHYYFTDLNARVAHRFSERATGFASVYFGNDMLRANYKESGFYYGPFAETEENKLNFHWGNFVAQLGLNYRLNRNMTAEFTAAYTRYFSYMKNHNTYTMPNGDTSAITEELIKTNNNINDWILRGDFDWQANDNSRVRFGANYVRHSFLPARTTRFWATETERIETRDSTWSYGANEINAYIEDDWKISERFRVNAGLHASLFTIDGKVKHGLSPRLSLSYRPAEAFAIKGAYSRTTQYVHQLAQSYLSLPTDQWIPISGNFKPQNADKIAVGGYWHSENKTYAVSVEGYYKWMHNLVEYCEEYYLKPPMEAWNARLTQGSGTAKGIDFKIEKLSGRFTGHIAYSLAWADRTFAAKNGGHTYPARFDNRHSVNILINWKISNRVALNASWTGHSGNRFTLLPQMWETPPIDDPFFGSIGEAPLKAPINNYRLPFYHRLDLSCTVRNSRGYWTFGLYNAYNHMNVIGIKRGYKEVLEANGLGYSKTSVPIFQKIKLLPIIPSISYTWQF